MQKSCRVPFHTVTYQTVLYTRVGDTEARWCLTPSFRKPFTVIFHDFIYVPGSVLGISVNEMLFLMVRSSWYWECVIKHKIKSVRLIGQCLHDCPPPSHHFQKLPQSRHLCPIPHIIPPQESLILFIFFSLPWHIWNTCIDNRSTLRKRLYIYLTGSRLRSSQRSHAYPITGWVFLPLGDSQKASGKAWMGTAGDTWGANVCVGSIGQLWRAAAADQARRALGGVQRYQTHLWCGSAQRNP